MDLKYFDNFRDANISRNAKWNNDKWSRSDWFQAILGELGEAANKSKKIRRYELNQVGNKQTLEELVESMSEELADTYIYLDLLCYYENINIEKYIKQVFNRKSEELGFPERLK